MALNGKKLISLPYVVKGMDLSLSGLLTAATTQLHRGCRLEDLCYSLRTRLMVTETQGASFSTYREERSSVKRQSAANKRLQSMLNIIAEEHDATFNVVPLQFAADNGAMIAWTGVLAFKHRFIVPINESYVKLRWRVDKVEVPWIQ
ncbi:MAG: hypothetical protein U5K74_09350 [Gemmatimonadaceae bacterium]|nr:hypothetical protein [Gemmatimonadaceae bacterium]